MKRGAAYSRQVVLLVAVAVWTAGCAAPPPIKPMDYSKLLSETPRSIVIVPVLNNSPEVGADELFLATITLPIAERGYYVFPVNLTRELLLEAGLADPGLVHQTNAQSIAGLFGADAVLYVRINNWEAKYLFLTTTVDVSLGYELRSGKSGETLWSAERWVSYAPKTSSSGEAALVEMIIDALVTKLAPNYIPLARQANHIALGNIRTNYYGIVIPNAKNPYWISAIAASAGGQTRTGETNEGRVLLYGPYHPGSGTDGPNAPSPEAKR